MTQNINENMYVARDKNGELFVYELKPIHKNHEYFEPKEHSRFFKIPKKHFREITYRNSPVKITNLNQEIKLKNKL